MSWLSDGRYISDESSTGKPLGTGADVPELAQKYKQLRGEKS